MRSFMICVLNQILLELSDREDEVGGACRREIAGRIILL
jgi:hypothetical protein